MVTWAERVVAAEATKCGHYGGCGCAAYRGCCTECPLPVEVCDRSLVPTNQGRRGINMFRDTEIRGLRRGGMPIGELADRFGMSERNTLRILAGGDIST